MEKDNEIQDAPFQWQIGVMCLIIASLAVLLLFSWGVSKIILAEMILVVQ